MPEATETVRVFVRWLDIFICGYVAVDKTFFSTHESA